MHIKIFTARQGYLSIETRATAVFASERVIPRVVRTSRYLNQENIQVPTVYIRRRLYALLFCIKVPSLF